MQTSASASPSSPGRATSGSPASASWSNQSETSRYGRVPMPFFTPDLTSASRPAGRPVGQARGRSEGAAQVGRRYGGAPGMLEGDDAGPDRAVQVALGVVRGTGGDLQRPFRQRHGQ